MTLTLTVCILSKLDQIASNSASNSIKEWCSHAAKKQINRYFKLSPNRMRNNHTLNQFSNNIGHHPDFFLATSFSLLDGSNKIKPRKRKAEPFERIILNQTYYLYTSNTYIHTCKRVMNSFQLGKWPAGGKWWTSLQLIGAKLGQRRFVWIHQPLKWQLSGELCRRGEIDLSFWTTLCPHRFYTSKKQSLMDTQRSY